MDNLSFRDTARMQIDWSLGQYETTAAQLLPAARAVVDHAALAPGERVVDVGCGTGNAALLAAARGAHVTGVDPAGRLLEVAREQATERGLDARFVQGEAAGLPLVDASAEVLLSVFGVIFAPDAAAAAAEMARVATPGGRIVLSAWIPGGAMLECVDVFQKAVMKAVGGSASTPGFAWHDREALAGLLAPHGFTVAVEEERLSYTAGSAREYLETQGQTHPLSIAGRMVLASAGEAQPALERGLAILEAANEDPDAFCVTSRYVVATARRG
ncbi:MAG: class I SAM-dependent methyltransferase [Candidatus Dormibacteria bacterium]